MIELAPGSRRSSAASLAGQIVTIAGNYSGSGSYVIDLGDRIAANGSATLSGTNATVRHPGGVVGQDVPIFHAGRRLRGTNFAIVTMPGFDVSVTYLAFSLTFNRAMAGTVRPG